MSEYILQGVLWFLELSKQFISFTKTCQPVLISCWMLRLLIYSPKTNAAIDFVYKVILLWCNHGSNLTLSVESYIQYINTYPSSSIVIKVTEGRGAYPSQHKAPDRIPVYLRTHIKTHIHNGQPLKCMVCYCGRCGRICKLHTHWAGQAWIDLWFEAILFLFNLFFIYERIHNYVKTLIYRSDLFLIIQTVEKGVDTKWIMSQCAHLHVQLTLFECIYTVTYKKLGFSF